MKLNYKPKIAICKLLFVFISILNTQYSILAQQSQVYKPSVNRILFVLDVSGSMKEKWGEKTKFETAKELLCKLIDSVEKKNPNVEFAVRAFGYQFSKLNLDFFLYQYNFCLHKMSRFFYS